MARNDTHAVHSTNADSKYDAKERSTSSTDGGSFPKGTASTREVEVQDDDARLLARIGYKQVSVASTHDTGLLC
jgi:hypothetical protein